MDVKTYHHPQPFELESGDILPEFQLAYATYGKISPQKDNVIWVCHALTGNAEVDDWWEGLFGEDSLFNSQDYYVVCVNMLGSCYGSTQPLSINPDTQKPYFHGFPQVSIRDMIKAYDKLRDALGISSIKLLMGGSMGGQQVLEWAIQQPDLFDYIIPMATNARHSAWGIAFNESQRMAIAADESWANDTPEAGLEGMRVARSIALLSYRSYLTYGLTQTDEDLNKLDNYRASSYQQYQGDKLAKRFNAFSYWILSKAMDSHNVGRNRESIPEALNSIKAKTLIIGISSDVLFPVSEQEYLQRHIPGASMVVIDSRYGHDGFLIETKAIKEVIEEFLQNRASVAA